VRYGLFEVTGHFNYRGHKRGERFESRITPPIERGVARGNIVMLQEIIPDVPPGYVIRGWPPGRSGGRTQTTMRRREAPLSLGEE
jgi:hypothetical protein